jgi:molybdate transport system substrate-binding protein
MFGIVVFTIGFLFAGAAYGDGKPPTVFAAASLNTVLQELMKEEGEKRGLRARFSFASSSALARQIAEGAPADLFFSANVRWMEYLEKEKLIAEGTRVDLLGNRLVVVAPKGEGFVVEPRREFDFAGAFSGRLAMGDLGHVPAGIYARQALEQLGWWQSLVGRLVPAPDVRAALVFVERGECAAGVVYATDAMVSKKVEVVAELPAEGHEPIVYPVAAIRGHVSEEVEPLLRFFRSPEAAAVFARHGFLPLYAKVEKEVRKK